MLLEFSVKNFLSFKDETTLSLIASNITELDENIIDTESGLNILKSAAIYGANASGKSNLLQSISFLRGFVLNSSKDSQAGEKIPVIPFLLDKQTINQPSYFEVVFLINDIRYRYGFEVNRSTIISEWLFHCRKRETNLFYRENKKIKTSSAFREGSKSLIDKTRDNALFLSVCAQFNGEISSSIINWFDDLVQLETDNDSRYHNYSLDQIKHDSVLKEKMLSLLKKFDIGILDISVEDIAFEENQIPEEIQEELFKILRGEIKDNKIFLEDVNSVHPLFEGEKRIGVQEIPWMYESSGTKKLLNISGPIFDSLSKGYVLIIDEIDIRLHPLITQALIRLFHSKETNPNNAQLILATHDPKLMSSNLFRRDQIWFTEKDKFGSSQLYSLVEFKPRKKTNIEKAYMDGRFGGIPYINKIADEFSKEKC